MLKFADDTKVICPIEKEEMDQHYRQIQLNIEKVMHFGYNPCLEYTMGGAKLTLSESE